MRAVLMMLVLALAFAGAAEGKSEKGRSVPTLPDHAKGHGVAPAEPVTAPAHVEERHVRGPTRTSLVPRPLLPSDVAAPSPLAPPVPPRVADARIGDGTTLMAQSVDVVQPASVDVGPSWLRALWVLPLAALGALGIVLVARREKRPHLAPPPVPDDVPALLRAGEAAVARADLVGAIAYFDRALALSPGLAVALFCKGVCLAELGRLTDAYEALKAATVADPADGGALVHLARVALALGRPGEAMDALEPIASAAPEIGGAMMRDPQLAALRDHPRFLMMCGAL